MTRTAVSVLPGFNIYWPHHCYNAIKSFDSLLKVGHEETHLLVVACHEDSNLCLELEAGKPRDKFHMTQCRLHLTAPAISCELHSRFPFFFYRLKHCLKYILKVSPCWDHSKALKLMRGKKKKRRKEIYISDSMQRFFYMFLSRFKIKYWL